jgi:hypothetical protein
MSVVDDKDKLKPLEKSEGFFFDESEFIANRTYNRKKLIRKLVKEKGLCIVCLQRGNAHWKDRGAYC